MRRPLLRHYAWALSVSLAVLAYAVATTAFAQTDVTTSRISGTVKDAEGGALPGVSVEGKNQDTGLVANATTNQQGFYQLLNLPTGSYTVTATISGFQTTATENVRLLLGSAPTVNFTLQLAGVAERVEVKGDVPVVEVTNTAASTTIQTEQLKSLPINGRDFKQLVTLTPSASIESQRGYVQISGQRGINTNVTVDGVDFNDAFFGGTYGIAEGRSPLSISQESIKEFTVITNGASVEFGRSAGGFVNVITKSGTNKFHGSAFYYYQPQEWIADFADGSKPRDQQKKQYGASLGGPILTDRLFFFGSYDKQKQSVTVPILADVLNPAIFDRYPVLASPPDYIQTRDAWVAFGRLDSQLGSSHRLMVRGNFSEYDGLNGQSDSQSRTESYNALEGLKTDSYVASYSGVFGPSIIDDLNLNYIQEDTPRQDKGLNLPEIQVGGNRYGELFFTPTTATSKRKAISDTLTYLIQGHLVKAGGEYNDTSITQVFRGNWRGTFVFANLSDFLSGQWREYRQFGGLGGRTSTQAGTLSYGQKELAFFLQDQWFLSPSLTVTAGVRWERLDNPNAPILNPLDRNSDGSFKLNAQIPDVNNQWSPRLGIAWSPDPKTVLRVSVGRFWSRTPALLFSQLFAANGIVGTTYTIFAQRNSSGAVIGPPTDSLSPAWGSGWDPVGVERIDFTRIPTPLGIGVNTIDPDFSNPYTDRLTFNAEREILPKTSAAITLTYAKSKQLQRLTDINRVYDGTLASNGLPRYSSQVPDPYYSRIITSVSDAESRYKAVTLQLQRRFAQNFNVFASGTWSEDKDHDSNERNFSGIQAEDFNNLELNYAFSDRDQKWRASVGAVWDTPWWGIGLSGSYRYSSGRPYTAIVNSDLNNDAVSSTDRPTVNGVHFDRNSFRQPNFYSLDLRVSKAFRIGPGDLTGLIECFNCANSANRNVPLNNQIWGTGQTPRAGFDDPTGVGTPRTFQLAARYDF